jgi:hypothetical protein
MKSFKEYVAEGRQTNTSGGMATAIVHGTAALIGGAAKLAYRGIRKVTGLQHKSELHDAYQHGMKQGYNAVTSTGKLTKIWKPPFEYHSQNKQAHIAAHRQGYVDGATAAGYTGVMP